MNQQRSRRFRTAKEMKELVDKAKRKGEVIPEGEGFDSNCITPGASQCVRLGARTEADANRVRFGVGGADGLRNAGTPFMARLSAQLKYFIAKKVSEDADWRGVEIVLSGHDVRLRRLRGAHLVLTVHALYRSQERASTRLWSASASRRRNRATTLTFATACTASTPTSSCSVSSVTTRTSAFFEKRSRLDRRRARPRGAFCAARHEAALD